MSDGPTRDLRMTLRRSMTSFERVARALGLPEPDPSEPKTFTFHMRRKPATYWEIGLSIGRFWVNLTSAGDAPRAPTLLAARLWAMSFAAEHGFDCVEAARHRNRPAFPARIYQVRPTLRVIQGGRS